MEAASVGSERIKSEIKQEEGSVARVRPGKYSRKNRKGAAAAKQCVNCSNKACKGGDRCFAQMHGVECFDCHIIGHFKGAAACKKKSAKPKDKSRRISKKKESDCSSSTDVCLRKMVQRYTVSHPSRASMRPTLLHMFVVQLLNVTALDPGICEGNDCDTRSRFSSRKRWCICTRTLGLT